MEGVAQEETDTVTPTEESRSSEPGPCAIVSGPVEEDPTKTSTARSEPSPKADEKTDKNETYRHEGGERIKAFHEKYNVNVSIPVTHTALRTAIITGTHSVITRSLVDIIPYLKKPPVESFEGREHQINLIVPEGYAPIIIGSRGSRIMSLRKVFDHNLPYCDERLIVISGELKNVISVIGSIMTYMEQHNLHKTTLHFDCERVSHQELLNYLKDPPPYSSGSYREPRGRPSYPPSYAQPYSDHSRHHHMPTHTTQVSIPVKHVHTVMGRQGYNLRKIESASGCKVILEDPQPNCSLRIISLTGTEKQINDAEYYLQETIRAYERNKL